MYIIIIIKCLICVQKIHSRYNILEFIKTKPIELLEKSVGKFKANNLYIYIFFMYGIIVILNASNKLLLIREKFCSF